LQQLTHGLIGINSYNVQSKHGKQTIQNIYRRWKMRSFTETIECTECAGTGEIEIEVYDVASFSNPYGDIAVRYDVCPECNGSGEEETDD
jgi:hypothetical protein